MASPLAVVMKAECLQGCTPNMLSQDAQATVCRGIRYIIHFATDRVKMFRHAQELKSGGF